MDIRSKFLHITAFMLAFSANLHAQNLFLQGTIKGARDGQKLYLKTDDSRNYRDSAIIVQERFRFKDSLLFPVLYQIVLETKKPDPKDRTPVFAPVIALFLNPGEIEVSAEIDSLQTLKEYLYTGTYDYKRYKVKGSKPHDEYLDYLKGYKPFSEASKKSFDDYITYLNPPKGKEKGSVEQGIALITRIDAARAAQKKFILDYAHNNRQSYVALQALSKGISFFNAEEIPEIISALPDKITSGFEGQKFISKSLTSAKSAEGANFIDFDFKTDAGQPVKLSDYLGKGKYVLLEFWASWCGPCRADLPHLKEAYSRYHNAGFEVISISLDDKKEAWLKAIAEEKMPWLQVSDLKAFNGELSKRYNFNGIPTCVLIGPDGKIVTRNMRGSWMDKKLIELYGNKFNDISLNIQH